MSPDLPLTVQSDRTILAEVHTEGFAEARNFLPLFAELEKSPATPMVVLGTAHPAKFPDAVEHATGVRPPLPEHLSDLYQRTERMTRLPNDQKEIEDFIRHQARAARGAVS